MKKIATIGLGALTALLLSTTAFAATSFEDGLSLGAKSTVVGAAKDGAFKIARRGRGRDGNGGGGGNDGADDGTPDQGPGDFGGAPSGADGVGDDGTPDQGRGDN